MGTFLSIATYLGNIVGRTITYGESVTEFNFVETKHLVGNAGRSNIEVKLRRKFIKIVESGWLSDDEVGDYLNHHFPSEELEELAVADYRLDDPPVLTRISPFVDGYIVKAKGSYFEPLTEADAFD